MKRLTNKSSEHKQRTTIKDVAARAGVSVSTVSYVLSGDTRHVGLDKRARVMEAIRDLNYRPNVIARSMVKRATRTIGLVITTVENPLFTAVNPGVHQVLQAEGYHLVLASAANLEAEIEAVETLRARQVDGFIFMSLSRRYPTEHLRRLQADGVPFVVINRNLDDSTINRVQLDDVGAGRMAAEHLIRLGHTRIATLSGPIQPDAPIRSAIDRHGGWRSALQAHGLPIEEAYIVSTLYSFQDGYTAMLQLLQQSAEMPPPTALFVANDTMAMGALKALHDQGLRVPHDLAIVAVGDPAFAAYTIPALTTLSLPIEEAGRVAARMLLQWIKGEPPVCAQSVTLSCSLVVRESCGARRQAQA